MNDPNQPPKRINVKIVIDENKLALKIAAKLHWLMDQIRKYRPKGDEP
jgi:hypothetical protein